MAILHFFIFALVDRRNRDAPGGNLAPFFIGSSVAIIISALASLTQAGLNPARDLGQRREEALTGWGSIALPGPNSIWWAYIAGPLAGGQLGATLYDLRIRGVPVAEQQPVLHEDLASRA